MIRDDDDDDHLNDILKRNFSNCPTGKIMILVNEDAIKQQKYNSIENKQYYHSLSGKAVRRANACIAERIRAADGAIHDWGGAGDEPVHAGRHGGGAGVRAAAGSRARAGRGAAPQDRYVAAATARCSRRQSGAASGDV